MRKDSFNGHSRAPPLVSSRTELWSSLWDYSLFISYEFLCLPPSHLSPAINIASTSQALSKWKATAIPRRPGQGKSKFRTGCLKDILARELQVSKSRKTLKMVQMDKEFIIKMQRNPMELSHGTNRKYRKTPWVLKRKITGRAHLLSLSSLSHFIYLLGSLLNSLL